jgi:general secretion pathway protein B
MSFILDALKKSESDRQRQSGPSLFEVKVAPPRRTLPIWAMAIGVLLGVNAVVVSWMLLRHAPAQQPAAGGPAAAPPVVNAPRTVAPTTPATAAAASTPSVASAPGAALRSAAPSPTATASSAAASPAGPSRQPPASAAPLAGTEPGGTQADAGGNPSDYAPAVEPAAAPDAGASAGTAGDLPLYQQVVTSDGLPALHLDLHVYAKRPADRFVMINMHRLGEGDSLPNGVQVEAIRPDGAVLSYRGTRFLLPRD